MKKFIRNVDWKRFLKLELIIFAVLTILYLLSLIRGANTFPDHVWYVPGITFLTGVVLMLATISDYLQYRYKSK